MHFFADNNLPSQSISDAFAPDVSSPANKFNITSRFQLTSQLKAFACQDSLMIVQQSSVDSTLVNVILKPIEGLKIQFRSVKYFVFRGILKDSFISGLNITPANSSNTEFISRFWTEWNDYKTKTNQPTLTDPTPQCYGYDTSLLGTLSVENVYDNSQTDVRALFVKEGEWIGNFSDSFKIGFEIIIQPDNLTLDLDFLRSEKFQVDVNGFTGLDLRAKREQILSFIDPAAFYGLHYDSGVNISTYSGATKTTILKKQNEIYSFLLENKFATQNRVYLDIRSEKGLSYNFYQNYNDGSGNNIKIGNSVIMPVPQSYENNNWPIIFIDVPQTTTSSKNDIKINLRIDDNIKPIVFIENTSIIKETNHSHFIDETKLLNGSDWSKDLSFAFPNTGTGSNKLNIAYYINLYYFRQEHNPSSPNTVLQNENYFDSAFCPIDLNNLGDANLKFTRIYNEYPYFIHGQFPNTTDKFGYVSENGAIWDNTRVVFFSQSDFQQKNTQQFYSSISNLGVNFGFNLEGDFNKMSFLSKDIQLSQTNMQENIGSNVYQKLKLLDIVNYNGFPNTLESIFCLGITQSELSILKNITGFSDKHKKYIYIEEITGSPFTDKDGKLFKKFKLKVQGLDNNGNRLIASPINDIYVYNQLGFVFASKTFAELETNQLGLVYKRNYEENVGLENIETTTHKHYEDYFIEDINPNIQVEVDGFISALTAIPNDENAYMNIKTLVEDSAKDIWDESVIFAQANGNSNADDRPLYWARNKMQVALKSHPYFENQFLFSDINPGSELEKMIQLFEENSRNYTNIDFSYATTHNLKKILITGFDPFFLNEKHPIYGPYSNIKQSNPSGSNALALHGKILKDTNNNDCAYVQTMIIPVRYSDFDNSKIKTSGIGNGIIETYIKPFVVDSTKRVDMVITVSQSGPDNFNIDRFGTRTRGGTIDNLGYTRQKSSSSINLNSDENEFEWIQTTLPKNMVPKYPALANDPNPNINNHWIIYAQNYTIKYDIVNPIDSQRDLPENTVPPIASDLGWNKKQAPIPLQKGTKILEGTGGNYLSNEIFYRVALIRERWLKTQPTGTKFPTGHFHVSKLQNESIREDFSRIKTKKLISTIEDRIKRGVLDLSNLFDNEV